MLELEEEEEEVVEKGQGGLEEGLEEAEME